MLFPCSKKLRSVAGQQPGCFADLRVPGFGPNGQMRKPTNSGNSTKRHTGINTDASPQASARHPGHDLAGLPHVPRQSSAKISVSVVTGMVL